MENLVDIRTLSLNNNKFKTIPHQIKSYFRLFSLTMKDNQLESIDDDLISYLPEL
jgi:Leucine-rich repeat (LRR) protein